MNAIQKIRILTFLLLLLVTLQCLPQEASAASSTSKAGAVTTASTTLNVRSKASSSAQMVARLNKGSYVTLISKTGDWWKVEYAAGKYGYCHAAYITPVQGDPVTVNIRSGWLNVRSGPGTGYGKTASLKKGDTVLLLSSSSGWSRVLYHGTKTGYVSAQYLTGRYPAVSLAVPSFKQIDSRWAEKTIGTSGKTFAQIGCATTAVSMIESYRSGTTVYPDKMALSLRYTPSGDLYWPEHYKVVMKEDGYLNAIYEKLQQGKPVLLGMRNSYGSQHWVVVTGFSGGAELTASSFQIHDPGSHYRTNLQQFLTQYPVFYKYFYY